MGRATAQLFASEGASVAIVDINEALGNEVAEEINASGGEAIFCSCNVSNETEVQSSIAATVDRFGGMQIIFNCAAKGIAKRRENMTEAEWDELMAINVKSIFFSLKHGIQHLEKNQHSYVVNIGSISSFVAQVDTPAYTTTKGAVLLLSQSIALDYAHLGLRCNCLCPGLADTPMMAGYYDRITDGDKFLAKRIQRVPPASPAHPSPSTAATWPPPNGTASPSHNSETPTFKPSPCDQNLPAPISPFPCCRTMTCSI